jgi:hypothetical protein
MTAVCNCGMKMMYQKTTNMTISITHVELGMDFEIVVKIRDEALRTELRKAKPAEINLVN